LSGQTIILVAVRPGTASRRSNDIAGRGMTTPKFGSSLESDPRRVTPVTD